MHIKVQKRNPHNLTIRQHIFPQSIIKKFCDSSGCVDFFDLKSATIKKITPKDILFCTKRVWDEQAESGYMKSIEERFLNIANEATFNKTKKLSQAENIAVSEMHILWKLREQYRDCYPDAIMLNGMLPPHNLPSIDEQEKCEAVHVISMDSEGKIPARNMLGITIQKHIMAYRKTFSGYIWAKVYSHNAEFIVPDQPKYNIMPFNPTACFIQGEVNKRLTYEATREVNLYQLAAVKSFYWGHNLSQCPSIK